MSLDEEIVRREYGFLEHWGCIHLNCCSVGVPPQSVQRTSQNFFSDQAYMRLVMGQMPQGYEPERNRTRGKIARLIHAGDGEIAFVGSTTEGLAVLATGCSINPGENVVICDLENPSCMYPWAGAAQNRGFELKIVHTEHGEITPEEIFRLADSNTKVVVLSAVQYGTGFFADLKTIGEECRRRGIVFAVDAVQAIGRMKIDVQDMNIDFLSCGGFKGIGAGFGVGFIYCRQELAVKITPAFVGVNSTEDCLTAPDVFDRAPNIDLRQDARRLENGSQNTTGIALLDAGVDVLLKLGVENIQAHVLRLENVLREALADSGLYFDGPQKQQNRSGIVVVRYPEALYPSVQELLERYHIILTSHPGYMRMAIHCYNTEEHMEVVAAVLQEIAHVANQEGKAACCTTARTPVDI